MAAKKATAKQATAKKTPGKRRTKAPAVEASGLAPNELAITDPSDQVAELANRVRADGGEVLSLYRDPLGAHALLLAALPIDKVKPTPFQRDVSEAHVRKLTVAMGKTSAFSIPSSRCARARSTSPRTDITAWWRSVAWELAA